MTLWSLPAEVEDRFESEWPRWIEHADSWAPYFAAIQVPQSKDFLQEASRLGLTDDATLLEVQQLRRASENRAVPISGEHRPSDRILTRLALGFFRGEPGELAVPYTRLGG